MTIIKNINTADSIIVKKKKLISIMLDNGANYIRNIYASLSSVFYKQY